MPSGIVKYWNDERGFGFIKSDDGGPDTFVHVRQIESAGIGPVDVGDRLAFEIATNPRTGRPEATELRLLSGAEARQ